MMKTPKYFTFLEMIKSSTADKNNIDNNPTNPEIIDNINYTMERLDEIREKYGKPIIITSGYRCQELNKKVGGKSNSFHLKGLAADLKYSVELWTFLTQHAKFDKLILETSKSAKWIHCQFSKENERNQILSLNV